MKNLTLLLLVAVAACSSPVSVSYDYDRNTNFNTYKTYNYADDTGSIDTVASPFFKQRVMNAVDMEMAERGYSKADDPDLLVGLHVKREDRQDAIASSNYPVGYWPWGFGYASGFNTTHVNYNDYVEGTLFINLVDAEKEKIVWQGIATKTLDRDLTPEQREKNVYDAVDRIFNKYPVKPISQ